MKKTLFFLIIFGALIMNLKAQESMDSSIIVVQYNSGFFIEASTDPMNIGDVRGSIGFGFFRVESALSFEYFEKSSTEIYKGIDLSLTYLRYPEAVLPAMDKKFNYGWGGKLGYVFDYGGTVGCFVKAKYTITKHIKLSAQAGYYGVEEDWGFYPEARLGIIWKF